MDTYQTGWNKFIHLCLKTKDEKILSLLFDLFFTPEEKTDVSMRYLIIKELISGKKTQRKIAQDLNVSIAKITRGSNELKRMNRKLMEYLSDHL